VDLGLDEDFVLADRLFGQKLVLAFGSVGERKVY